MPRKVFEHAPQEKMKVGPIIFFLAKRLAQNTHVFVLLNQHHRKQSSRQDSKPGISSAVMIVIAIPATFTRPEYSRVWPVSQPIR